MSTLSTLGVVVAPVSAVLFVSAFFTNWSWSLFVLGPLCVLLALGHTVAALGSRPGWRQAANVTAALLAFIATYAGVTGAHGC